MHSHVSNRVAVCSFIGWSDSIKNLANGTNPVKSVSSEK